MDKIYSYATVNLIAIYSATQLLESSNVFAHNIPQLVGPDRLFPLSQDVIYVLCI